MQINKTFPSAFRFVPKAMFNYVSIGNTTGIIQRVFDESDSNR